MVKGVSSGTLPGKVVDAHQENPEKPSEKTFLGRQVKLSGSKKIVRSQNQASSTTGPGSSNSLKDRKVAVTAPQQSLLLARSGRNYIAETIDGGVKATMIPDGTLVLFSNTAGSLAADGDLGKPVTCRKEAEESPECLGSGSNGCVQACTVKGEQVVAKRSYSFLDKFKKKEVQNYIDASGIMREIGVLAGLKALSSEHPGFSHIVPFIGAGVSKSGEPLIFLARADQSLEQALENGGLTPDRVASYAGDLFSGLDCMASLNLVHQDIKPGNLLLKDGCLWLADFGETTADDGFASRSLTGDKLSTVERIAGTQEKKPFFTTYEDPTPASDVWAAGLSIIAMMNPSQADAFIKKLHAPPLKLSPANDLTAEQMDRLRGHCHAVVDEFLEASMMGQQQEKLRPAFAEILYQILEPDPMARISAREAARTFKMYGAFADFLKKNEGLQQK